MLNLLKKAWEKVKMKDNGSREILSRRGISEPVISFVTLLEEHPENFLCAYDYPGFRGILEEGFKLIDEKNKQVYHYRVSGMEYNKTTLIVKEAPFLTEQEKQLLLEKHNIWYRNYVEGILTINEKEKSEIREKYVNIYCEE